MRLRNVLLLAVVASAGGALALEFAARSAAAQMARALSPRATLTYDSAGVTLDGSVRLHSPRIEVQKGIWRSVMHARTAELRGGSFFWLFGRLLSGAAGAPEALTVRINGLSMTGNDAGDALSSWVGTPDLALFENQGCGSDALGDKDRSRMGVEASERVDRFEYRYDPLSKSLQLGLDLDSANIASWQGYAEFSAFDPARFSQSASQKELRLVRAGLSYRDPGYLSRRNTFCAQWLGVTSAEFVDRHIEAVRTFLGTRGISPSEDVISLYQRLVTRGGSLNLASLPDASWVPAEFEAYPRQVLLRQLNITARLDDAPPVMLRLVFSEPEIPLYVVKSVAAMPPVDAPAATVEPPAIGTPPEPERAEAPPSPPSQSRPLPLAQTPTAAAAPAVSTGVDEVPATASVEALPSRVDRQGKVIASAPPPPPDSTLALVWKPGVIERLPPQVKKELGYTVISSAGLGQHIGRRVQLVTGGGKRVDGEVHAIEPGNLVLLVQVGRGSAKLDVPLANIREVRLLRSR